MATKYVKWVYIADQTEPNPYAVFPSYFNRYLSDLSTQSITTTYSGDTNNATSTSAALTHTVNQSRSIPEFPFTVPILLVSFVSIIVFYRISIRK